MKKLLSAILVVFIMASSAVSVFAMGDAKYDWEPTNKVYSAIPRDENVVARLVMGSDVHIGAVNASPKLSNAYNAIGQLGGADAFILIGDLTNNGRTAQYEELMRIVSENTESLTVDNEGFTGQGAGAGAPVKTTILAMGNHEYYDNPQKAQSRFMDYSGQALDKLYWVAGAVPVIKISMTSSTYTDNFVSKHDFIKASLDEIDATGYKGHIFLVSHMATGGTVVGAPNAENEPFAQKTIKLLQKYPQLIHVSGHSHQQINNPTFIDQTLGFTSVTDGIVGEDYDNDPEALGSGVVIFDVKSDGTTEIHRVDLQNGRLLYEHEQWTLDASDKPEDFVYFNSKDNATNPDSYTHKSKAPTFPADAWVSVKDNGDFDSVDVTFTTNAISASENNHDFIRRYRVKATPVDGEGTAVTVNVVNDAFRPDDKRETTHTATITGLDWNKEYKFTVYAQTSYGVNSKSISAPETIKIGTPVFPKAKMLYDIDYSYGKTDDAFGHAAELSYVAKMEYDETVGQNAMTFNKFRTNTYAFGEKDFAGIKKGFSLEAYFKLVNVDEKQTIVSLLDAAGIELYVEDGELSTVLYVKNTNKTTPSSASINAGEWVHAVVVYNSKDIQLYVNGTLMSTVRHSGGLSHEWNPDEAATHIINLGGRAAAGENFLLEKGSKINRFRLYGGMVTEDEVKVLYHDAAKANITLPFADVAGDAWYADTVRYAYEYSLMNGTSGTAFSPSVATSRAMIVQLLYNMEGRPAVEYNSIFTDVAEDAWYADAVIWAFENGVTTGSSATTFSPDDLVTREQVAVFLYRFMKDYKGEEMAQGADLSTFPDADKISPYSGFAEAVAWANGVGIITGKTSSGGALLAPLDNAQRCESATMFARFHRSFVA
ncbi:MAG: S-layer homology domain-containing protein [Clostridia bacterium]|nr:S-layer homology domain-containing protein [Clostridia bacterium]